MPDDSRPNEQAAVEVTKLKWRCSTALPFLTTTRNLDCPSPRHPVTHRAVPSLALPAFDSQHLLTPTIGAQSRGTEHKANILSTNLVSKGWWPTVDQDSVPPHHPSGTHDSRHKALSRLQLKRLSTGPHVSWGSPATLLLPTSPPLSSPPQHQPPHYISTGNGATAASSLVPTTTSPPSTQQ